MNPIYRQSFTLDDMAVDCHGRLKLSTLLFLAQEVAGRHSDRLGTDYDTLSQRRLFWAVTRHRVQITRLPLRGETVTVETWPMPTTRVAFPRSMVAYDAQGNELFRLISLWVLMDLDNRNMVLPGKSGVNVEGTLTGSELAVPHSLVPKTMGNAASRTVTYSCLDRNGHMNNTRYLDWVDDLLGSEFHRTHTPRELVICYHNEALEGQQLKLGWELSQDGCLQVDAHRENTDVPGKQDRIFSAQVLFE
jgi:medium-chain acyl-[acyl-carrier-protein] hydrolase